MYVYRPTLVSKPLEDESEKRQPVSSQRDDSKLKQLNYLTVKCFILPLVLLLLRLLQIVASVIKSHSITALISFLK